MASKPKKSGSRMRTNPLADYSTVMAARGMRSKYKKPPQLKKRKVSGYPKAAKFDVAGKSGGTDISKILNEILKK